MCELCWLMRDFNLSGARVHPILDSELKFTGGNQMNPLWSSMVKRTEPYIPGEQLNDPDILKLNTNENAYPPSSTVKKAIVAETEKLHLYPSPTVDSLRSTVAKSYNLRADQVFVGNGSDEVLAFSFMAFFEPGKAIRFPAITYSFYPVYCKLFHIPYEEMDLNRDYTLRPEDYFQSPGGVIFPNPNAPTGIELPLQHIADIAENNPDQVVIIDEAYVDFGCESAISLIDQYPNLLVVQTTSKSRALAGLRVGFAFGHPDLIEALIRMKDSFNSYTIDRLAMVGAEAAWKDMDYFKQTTSAIIQTRQNCCERLKQMGFHVLPSKANFLFVSHYRYRAEDLYQALKQNKVLVRHFNQAPIQNYLRITIGTDDTMDTFFQILGNIFQASHSLDPVDS